MALRKLSELNEWRVSNHNEDIRGKVLYERDGDRVGKIDDMLVDTDAKLARTVILENGERFSVDDIDIESDGVYLRQATRTHTEPRVKVYRGGESSPTRPTV